MKSMIRIMIVVATLFSLVATTIIPHHHHNDGETICTCHHTSCCHDCNESCNHHNGEPDDCANCSCSIKFRTDFANQTVKVPAPAQILTFEFIAEHCSFVDFITERLYEEQNNFPPNLIHKYIFYHKSVALRAPPQF